MKLSIGIVGLPNVGKSTLFNSLTNQAVTAANYPFATIDPNVGIVPVPDKRIDKLAEITGVPVIGMESPRGVNDPSLGALAEILPQADFRTPTIPPHKHAKLVPLRKKKQKKALTHGCAVRYIAIALDIAVPYGSVPLLNNPFILLHINMSRDFP